jgi:DNA polymerase-3 subunit gamma/tau
VAAGASVCAFSCFSSCARLAAATRLTRAPRRAGTAFWSPPITPRDGLLLLLPPAALSAAAADAASAGGAAHGHTHADALSFFFGAPPPGAPHAHATHAARAGGATPRLRVAARPALSAWGLPQLAKRRAAAPSLPASPRAGGPGAPGFAAAPLPPAAAAPRRATAHGGGVSSAAGFSPRGAPPPPSAARKAPRRA